MANIHLNRNRQPLGQFTPEEVAAGLKSGRFQPTDLAWTEGMETWKPLADFPNLPEVEEATPALAPGSEVAIPVTEIQPAWERRPQVPFFSAFFQTIKDCLAQPVTVFSALNPNGGIGAPLFFYLIIGTLTTLVAMLYQFGVALVDPSTLGKEFTGESSALPVAAVFGVAMLIMVLLMPILLAIGTFISAGILHVCLMLLGGAKKPFTTTYQISCYAYGAALVFQLVPVCGGVIAGIYGIVLAIIGVKHAEGIETSKAVIAVLLPVVLCCGLVLALVAVAGAAGYTEMMQEFAKPSGR